MTVVSKNHFHCRKITKWATELQAILRRLGHSEEEILGRLERAVAAANDRRVKKAKHTARPIDGRYVGCLSVTKTAQDLGVRRNDLFTVLERTGWLCRTADGWKATNGALADGWVVMRGSRAVHWAQITEAGRHEIARRIGVDRRSGP